MPISLFLALSPGPVHLQGHPRLKFQRMASCLFSSRRTTLPSVRRTLPSMACWIQFHRATSPRIPRFRTMLGNFLRPGIFLIVMSSAPLRYSMGWMSTSRPEASAKLPLTAVPSSLMPLMTISKLNPPYGSSRYFAGMGNSLLALARVRLERLLLDAEDHELGRLHGGDADEADEAP